MFYFVDSGVGGDDGADCVGDARSLGAGGDVADGDAAYAADEFYDEAGVAVAGDFYVAGAYAVQAFKGAGEGGDEGFAGDVFGYFYGGAVGTTVEREGADEVQRQVKFEFGVYFDGFGGFGGKGDPLVDVDQKVLYLKGQPFDADDGGADGGGLKAGEVPFGVCRVADEGEAEVDGAERDAHGVAGKYAGGVVVAAVDAGEGVDVVAADGDEVGGFDGAAVGEDDVLVPLFNGEAAFDAEEAEQVDVKGGGGFDGFAFASFKAEFQGCVGTGFDGKVGGVGTVVVNYFVAVFAGLVDGDADGAGAGGEAVEADKRERCCGGLKAGPGPGFVGLAG